ncbi:MAG: DUF485 domain-containing protein [Lautropia sp.]|nr:DUF485 domain-containing protein [Lautropia sp.]
MSDPVVEKIQRHPQYRKLRKERNIFGWALTIVMLVVYYGYIGLIAFDKSFLAQPISENAITSIGVPIGLGVIVLTVVLTGVYVYRANSQYDAMTRDILKDTTQ